MSNHNGATVIGDLCLACQQVIADDEPKRVMRQPQLDGVRREDDPVAGAIHEVCALRAENMQLQAHVQSATLLLAAVTKKLGGALRVHRSDLGAMQQSEGKLNVNEGKDGWIDIRIESVIFVPPKMI